MTSDQKPKRVDELTASFQKEILDLLRLVFGVCTGAVVLFVDLIARMTMPRCMSLLLATSITAFGICAFYSLKTILSLLRVREMLPNSTNLDKP